MQAAQVAKMQSALRMYADEDARSEPSAAGSEQGSNVRKLQVEKAAPEVEVDLAPAQSESVTLEARLDESFHR